jgi:hypothetical protein
MNITKEDLAKVSNRYNAITAANDPALSLRDNLVNHYLAERSTSSREEAEEIVNKLITGSEELTLRYHEALANGFNPDEKIAEITKEFSTEERFNFLINALSLVEALNLSAFPSQTNVKDAINSAIKKYASENPTPTAEDCEILQKLLTEAIKSNTLILSSSDQAQELLTSATDANTVIDFASQQYDDARLKAEMALAMWLEYEDGNIPSLEAGATPESIGVGAATAVEEAKVMNDVHNGNTTVDFAVKCLKILGGVALTCLIGYIGIIGCALISGIAAYGMLSILGTSTIACIATTAILLPLAWGMAEYGVKAGSYILDKAGKVFDVVVEKLRESVLPRIKEVAISFISWIKAKLGNQPTSNVVPVNT